MAATTSPRCAGKRRMQRGKTFGLYKCGRKATALFESRVGLSKTVWLCDEDECYRHASGGYSLVHIRNL